MVYVLLIDLVQVTSGVLNFKLFFKWQLHIECRRRPRGAIEHLCLPHFGLKEIEISGFSDQWNAMALAKYLLNHAVALEQFIVDSVSKIYCGSNRWLLYSLPLPMDDSERERVHNLLFREKVNPRVEVFVR